MTTEQHPLREVLLNECNITVAKLVASLPIYTAAIAILLRERVPLPSSILTYWSPGYKRVTAPGKGHNLNVYLELYPLKPPDDEDDPSTWYREQLGIIAKTEQLLKETGAFQVHKQVTADSAERLERPVDDGADACVILNAYTVDDNDSRDWDGPQWTIRFYHVDPAREPSATCRVEYEAVDIPARRVFRPKVVCDDDALPEEEGTTPAPGVVQEATS